jgi:hypothetical protein
MYASVRLHPADPAVTVYTLEAALHERPKSDAFRIRLHVQSAGAPDASQVLVQVLRRGAAS